MTEVKDVSMMASTLIKTCPYCQFFAPSDQLLTKHVRLVHSHDPDFRIQCEQCLRTFKNYRTFQNHILQHRSEPLINPNSLNEIENDCSEAFEGTDDEGEDDSCVHADFSIKDYSARWILKTGETRYLTRTAITGIVEDVSDMVKVIVDNLHTDIDNLMLQFGINTSDIEGYTEIFSNHSSPFDGLSTFYQQIQYYKSNFALVVSIQDIAYSSGLVMHTYVLQVNVLTGTSQNNIKIHTHSENLRKKTKNSCRER